jgi:putative transposase
VGEGGDEVSVARFIADQRTSYRVPVAVCCAILGLSAGWFYKWIKTPVTGQLSRRRDLDAKVSELFETSGRTYGSPRIHRDLVEAGWRVGENTVADSMRRQGLFGRKPKRSKGLTRQDKRAAKFPDLLRRDFTAAAPNQRGCGDITEIPTGEGKLYLATVIDLYSRRLLACPISEHPNAELAGVAIKIAAAVRGGCDTINGVIFHTDRGSTGEFQRSSQHLELRGGSWCREQGRCSRRRVRSRVVVVGSGRRIGRCGRRCVRPGGRCRPGRLSVRSGG